MKGTMKKAGILILVFSIGQIKALEPGVALASLEVNLNQLFEPNIKLFYDSSLQALNDAYTAAFNKLVEVGALDKANFKNKDADNQIKKDFIIEVDTKEEKNSKMDEFSELRFLLEKALKDYQIMFDLSMQKTGEPQQIDDLSQLAAYLVSPLNEVANRITIKPEPEPEIELVFEGFGTIEAQTPVEGDDAVKLQGKAEAAKISNNYKIAGKTAEQVKQAINTLTLLGRAIKDNGDVSLQKSAKAINGRLLGLSKSTELQPNEQQKVLDIKTELKN